MKINIITLFSDFFDSPLSQSLLGKTIKNKIIKINLVDLRQFGEGKHQIVDDVPYSGGPGLILKPDVAKNALNSVKGYKIIMSASGKLIDQQKIDELAKKDELTIICPRYEGFDERIINFVDEELCVANFVMSGGEVPALALIDAVARLQEGFMHTTESTNTESFKIEKDGQIMVEFPHYTRPETFEGLTVPDVLKSGNHQEIQKWQKAQAFKKTKKNRPDLLHSN